MTTPTVEALGEQTFVLRGFARTRRVSSTPLPGSTERRRFDMQTPGGFTMSVALTNSAFRLTSVAADRYAGIDPLTSQPWPQMPGVLQRLARAAAEAAGFSEFTPDACLVNRYAPGTRLTLHRDENERAFDAPIVSVSLGVPATFLFGGLERSDRAARIPLRHGDVAVWGGVDRLRYHGVLPLKEAVHPETGAHRFNLTLRRAG